MIKILLWIRKLFVYSKIFAQRTMSWVSIANSGMILFLVLDKLEINAIKWYIPIFISTMFLIVLLGYLEDKVGFYKEELRITGGKNPIFNEILERLEKIEKK